VNTTYATTPSINLDYRQELGAGQVESIFTGLFFSLITRYVVEICWEMYGYDGGGGCNQNSYQQALYWGMVMVM